MRWKLQVKMQNLGWLIIFRRNVVSSKFMMRVLDISVPLLLILSKNISQGFASLFKRQLENWCDLSLTVMLFYVYFTGGIKEVDSLELVALVTNTQKGMVFHIENISSRLHSVKALILLQNENKNSVLL